MQTSAISTGYLLRSLQAAAGLEPPSGAKGAGQIQPGGDGPPPGGCAPPVRSDSAGSDQFASSTLTSLLSTQQDTSPASGMAAKLISDLDTDGDGALSQSEVSNAVGGKLDTTSGFAKLDTNGDGSLGADELQTALQSRLGAHRHHGGGLSHAHDAGAAATGLVSALDTNGDGSLSLEEITAAISGGTDSTTSGSGTSTTAATTTAASTGLADTFGRLDANGNGQLSIDELTTALAQAFSNHRRNDATYASASTATASTPTTTAAVA